MSMHHDIWKQVLASLEVELDPSVISTWFKNTQLFETSEDRIIIACGDSYSRNIIQKRYSAIIADTLLQLTGEEKELEFIVKPQRISEPVSGPLFDEAPTIASGAPRPQSATTPTTLASPLSLRTTLQGIPNLRKNLTLDNYVVGISNRVVHAAALSIIENPGRLYNPLFIYGSTGVGKTHLLHAIGNGVVERNPDFKIMYTTTEKFVNDLIDHLRQKKEMAHFRQTYRNAHVLLVDDIQFLAGKESSQEEFYHTFNELYNLECQIALASDREPSQIAGLADRLVSRFQGGLLVKIDPPDYETRLAIVQSKAVELDMDLSPPVIEHLAQHSTQNVREIQGYLLQLKSFSLTQQQPINLAMARMILGGEENTKTRKRITPELILELVTQTCNTNIKDLCGKKRKKDIVIPRQLAMFLLRNELGMNLTEIGELLGGRDHTTIIHGCDKVKELIEVDQHPLLGSYLKNIRESLYA